MTCVVVYESGRRWIEHLRVRFHGQQVRVHHTTSAMDLLGRLGGDHDLILVAELCSRPLATLDLIERVGARRSDIATVVIAEAADQGLELAAREFGAAEFLCEPITPRELAELIARMVRARRRLT